MLKKLAKYGNSTTLVIDKAILELLNMDESTIVKLQTDGKSLIVTPVESSSQNKKISYDTLEALAAAKQSFESKMVHKTMDEDLLIKATQDFKRVFQKHNEVFLRFHTQISMSKAYQDGLKDIIEKIDPVDEPEAFYHAINKLKLQFCPELADMQKDMDAVGQKYSQLA